MQSASKDDQILNFQQKPIKMVKPKILKVKRENVKMKNGGITQVSN